LRNRQFLAYKFLRQHPIYYKFNNLSRFFIADFYCHELNLVIEIDGKIHENQKEYDQIRTEIINLKKIRVLRFKNDEIYSDTDLVMEKYLTS
jgi:very-short-patch-repair endonuclease